MTVTPFDIPYIEKKYNAKYVGDFPIKTRTGWGYPGAVFYDPNPDVSKGHKHLFGFYHEENTDSTIVYDATYLEGMEFLGTRLHDGEFAWSRYRHDNREVPGGFIDGGFDYLRACGEVKIIKLKIVDGKVTEV